MKECIYGQQVPQGLDPEIYGGIGIFLYPASVIMYGFEPSNFNLKKRRRNEKQKAYILPILRRFFNNLKAHATKTWRCKPTQILPDTQYATAAGHKKVLEKVYGSLIIGEQAQGVANPMWTLQVYDARQMICKGYWNLQELTTDEEYAPGKKMMQTCKAS